MNFSMMGKILMKLSTSGNGLDKVQSDGECLDKVQHKEGELHLNGEGLKEVGHNGEGS